MFNFTKGVIFAGLRLDVGCKEEPPEHPEFDVVVVEEEEE